MTIGQLSRAANVPTSTVRYYEREELLEPSGRTEGNYRVYGPEALERLRFIRAAQAVGFTLGDISTLLAFREDDDVCGDVQSLITDRMEELEQHLADLKRVRKVLKSYLKRCKEHADDGRCEVIDELSSASSVSE